MRTIMSIGVLGLLLSAFIGMSACVVQSDRVDEASNQGERLGDAEEELVTCTTNCSATGGSSITQTCTTCSATSSSITCDGVTTQCQPSSLPSCGNKCTYGVCTSCDNYGEQTTCYMYNGCGHKYPIP
jgi:hypothetical protein